MICKRILRFTEIFFIKKSCNLNNFKKSKTYLFLLIINYFLFF